MKAGENDECHKLITKLYISSNILACIAIIILTGILFNLTALAFTYIRGGFSDEH